jgi:hypothetical protein
VAIAHHLSAAVGVAAHHLTAVWVAADFVVEMCPAAVASLGVSLLLFCLLFFGVGVEICLPHCDNIYGGTRQTMDNREACDTITCLDHTYTGGDN